MAFSLAILVGLALGAFGGGGSILSVAVLSVAFAMPPKAAIAASLLISGVASSTALLVQRAGRLVSARVAGTFGGFSMVGAFLGARLVSLLPEPVLLTVFGGVMFLSGLGALRFDSQQQVSVDHAPSTPVSRLAPAALGVGVVTGMLGVGGGFLIVPALVLRARMSVKRALANSLVVVAAQSLAGFLGHLASVRIAWNVVVPFTLLATVGSVVGAAVAQRSSQALLRRSFASLLLLVAIVVVAKQLPRLIAFSRFQLHN